MLTSIVQKHVPTIILHVHNKFAASLILKHMFYIWSQSFVVSMYYVTDW